MHSLTILVVAAAGMLVRPGLALPSSPTRSSSNSSPRHALAGRAVSPDNTCGTKGVGGSANAYTCPEALPCCSVNGFCGSTTAHCLASVGCQAEFGSCGAASNDTTSPDMTCGGTVGYTCPTGLCCSSKGFCGSTTDYCGSGCQSNFGACGGGAPGNCTGGNAPGGGGTSTDGMCGPEHGFTSCGAGECCSGAGFCGTTPDHCRSPDCLFQYGPGCDANKVPRGFNTSAVVRAQPGGVEYGGEGVYNCVNPGDIALTFDDGPFIYTGIVLDLLKKYNAKASFMVTGVNNNKGEIDDATLPWAALIQRMYDEGHQIASHSFSHADLSNITAAERRNEMYKNEMAIRNIIGVFPTYMRPPFSSCSVASGCQQDMADLGYHVINFDLDTQDYLHTAPDQIQTSKDIFAEALDGKTPETDDFLVIGHDIHDQTANNLTEFMLITLLAKGFRPVTVGDCLGDPPENWYRTDTRTTLGQ